MITMKDIAKAAKVSRPTVSLVLNGRETQVRISEETKKKVLEAAEALGYRRNEIARSMMTGKTNIIGFLDESISPEYVARTLDGLVAAADSKKYFIKVFSYRQREHIEATVRRAVEQRPDGMICRSLPEEYLKHVLQECNALNIPVAIIGSSFPHTCGVRVSTNDRQGAELAVQHLIDLGHEKIGYLAGARGSEYVETRLAGFETALNKAGIEVNDRFVITEESPEEKDNALSDLFSSKDRPTAFFCASDIFAMICMRVARRFDLKVPEDLSIVGYADMEVAQLADPPLTTIAEPFEKVGDAVLSLLVQEIDSKQKLSFKKEISEELDVELVVRQSTCRAK